MRVLYYNGHCYTELVGAIELIHKTAHTMSIEGVEITFKDIKEINLYE